MTPIVDGSFSTRTQGFAHPPRNVAALRIEPGMHVADFGAGSGAYVRAIAERLENSGHVYAIDVQQDLLRRIHNDTHARGYTNVGVIWGDLEKRGGSKIADRHLDFVLISNLLFQVDDQKAVIAEACRILKRSGRIGIIDWSDSFGGMGPLPRDVVSKDAALALAREAGLELDHEFDAGAHHYGLVFKFTHNDTV